MHERHEREESLQRHGTFNGQGAMSWRLAVEHKLETCGERLTLLDPPPKPFLEWIVLLLEIGLGGCARRAESSDVCQAFGQHLLDEK